eukprot:CAMPEP_0113698940 /NCGR_PEP_ID=MMETSP0038_2-20120614/23009_1 /TAXON_ID=2898 /ORGANISM="Cryptomonas paramecium" /LENGTH=186 /DNA_ID=CAMNT_0000622199 /DNA_START=355 /DNA_END=912 /DNA_ORIENTATION=- /assembly_acc=CAM_ASM_000170
MSTAKPNDPTAKDAELAANLALWDGAGIRVRRRGDSSRPHSGMDSVDGHSVNGKVKRGKSSDDDEDSCSENQAQGKRQKAEFDDMHSDSFSHETGAERRSSADDWKETEDGTDNTTLRSHSGYHQNGGSRIEDDSASRDGDSTFDSSAQHADSDVACSARESDARAGRRGIVRDSSSRDLEGDAGV